MQKYKLHTRPILLFDTSCWIEHLRAGYKPIASALDEGNLLLHRWTVGELACGNINKRKAFLDDLVRLPTVQEISFNEVVEFIDTQRLFGKGLGWVDFQLLAACITADVQLVTLDKRLHKVYHSLVVTSQHLF